MYKIDLHTHSQASPDGSLKAADYKRLLNKGRLDYIAVTDHDRIDFARALQADIGDQIIVGQEVTTTDGDLIGLYLQQAVPPGLTARHAVEAIREQKGLVCVPHPFEKLRQGVQRDVLDMLGEMIDIIEVHNGRASLDARPDLAEEWAALNNVTAVSSSDAHGPIGWGRTYTVVAEPPTRQNLVKLLAKAELVKGHVGAMGHLYPKWNRLRGLLHVR